MSLGRHLHSRGSTGFSKPGSCWVGLEDREWVNWLAFVGVCSVLTGFDIASL